MARPLALLGVALLLVTTFLVVSGDRPAVADGSPAAAASASPPAARRQDEGSTDSVRRRSEPDDSAAAPPGSTAAGEVLVLRALEAADDAVDGRWTTADGDEHPFHLDPGARIGRTHLPAGDWRLEVPGWLAAPPRVRARPGNPQRIQLTPSRGGAFRVLDGEHPMPDVEVRLVAMDDDLAPDWRWEGRTDADGAFAVPSLPGGSAHALLVATDGRCFVGGLEAPPEGEVGVVSFLADVAPSPIRVVAAATGLPVAGALLYPGAFPDHVLATTGPDGLAMLPRRSSSLSNLEVAADGFLVRHAVLGDLAEVEGGPTLTLVAGTEATLRLLTPDGRPLAGARVVLLEPGKRGRLMPRSTADSDGEGVARLRLPREPAPGSLLVALHEDGWWGRLVPPPSPDSTPLDWTLEEPCPLVLAFADGPAPDGRPMRAVSIGGEVHDLTSEDGAFRVAAPFMWRRFLVPAPSGGVVCLDLASQADIRWRWFVEGRPEVLSGRIVLSDRAGHTARLRLVTMDDSPLADWPVGLSLQTRETMRANLEKWPEYFGHAPSGVEGWVVSASPPQEEGVTDEDGMVEFHGLAEGDYTIRVAPPSATRAVHGVDVAPGVPHLRVPLSETVEVRLPATLDLRLTVLDEAGHPIPDFRLQVADGPLASTPPHLVAMGLHGAFSEILSISPTTRFRVLALGRQPHEFTAPPRPGTLWTVHREVVRMPPLAPMSVVLAEDAPGPLDATLVVRNSEADRETGFLLASDRIRLVPGRATEVPGMFDGCWVEIYAPRIEFEPDGFIWRSGGETTLRIVQSDG